MKRLILIGLLLLPLSGCHCSCTATGDRKLNESRLKELLGGESEGVVLIGMRKWELDQFVFLLAKPNSGIRCFCRFFDHELGDVIPDEDEYWKVRVENGRFKFVEKVPKPKDVK